MGTITFTNVNNGSMYQYGTILELTDDINNVGRRTTFDMTRVVCHDVDWNRYFSTLHFENGTALRLEWDTDDEAWETGMPLIEFENYIHGMMQKAPA